MHNNGSREAVVYILYCTPLERLKDGNIHMCFFSRSFYKVTPVPTKSTFRYKSMFNFIPVSFSFFVIFRVTVRVRSVIGYSSGIKVRDRVRDR